MSGSHTVSVRSARIDVGTSRAKANLEIRFETRCLLPLTTTAATTAVATTSVPAALACALALSFWLSAAEGIMLGEVLYAEKGRVDHRLLLFLAMLACACGCCHFKS